MKSIHLLAINAGTSAVMCLITGGVQEARSLPPPQEVPEEVLRTEIITEARSPIDGKRLSAAEYVQLQAQLQSVPSTSLSPKVRELIFLIRVRQLLRSIGIPIK